MANYPFYFKVRLWSSENPDKEYISTGLGLSNSYAEAARQIEEYYGPKLIAIEYIKAENPSVDFEQEVPKSE